MNKEAFRKVGQVKHIVDFSPYASIYSEQHGLCYKANTADGLVVVNVQSGLRIGVASTEMFVEVENTSLATDPKK